MVSAEDDTRQEQNGGDYVGPTTSEIKHQMRNFPDAARRKWAMRILFGG